MAYYSSTTCGYVNGSSVYTGCTTDYESSEVKYVVGVWAIDKLNVSDLKEDNLGYKTRLITFEDLTNNLGFELNEMQTGYVASVENTPSWVYNSQYYYWTMSPYGNSTSSVWLVGNGGGVASSSVNYGTYGSVGIRDVVRPVITLLKSSI